MSAQNPPSRSQLWSACLGNLFEHYETALFGFLSVFLAPLIFPEQEPITALILTFAMIPLGMVARPIGSLVFGYIGDIYGRKHALFLTLAGMAVVSGGIAFSPTYQQAGFLSPIIFGLGRILQNFFSAGETMGGAIFLLENTPEKRHDLLSGLYNASTIGGILLASAGVSLLSYLGIIEWGWRFLYLFGCLTALFGCLLRSKQDASSFTRAPTSFPQTLSKLGMVFWAYRKALLLIVISSGFAYANYSIALVLINGFIPLISPLTKTEMMSLNTALLVLDFCTLPIFGWLSSKTSREKMMLYASLGVFLGGIPLFMLLNGASIIAIVVVRVCFVLFGVAFSAPFHAWAQQLVPPAYRYAIISFGYALGSQLLGGPTSAISLWLFKTTGIVSSVSWYWLALALASSLIIASTFKAKNKLTVVEEVG